MRLIYLPTGATVLLDIAAWLVIHLVVSAGFSALPLRHFDASGRWFRARSWERDGEFYAAAFRIRSWKRLLPDGAPLLGRLGFPKRHLTDTSTAHLETFIAETCRAEVVHWIILACAPWFFFWNKPGVGMLMLVYAAVENLPLIATQRYNRFRLFRVVGKRRAASAR
ncbi:glycosyl-4,4'-diaponeurosporenoate acyltransferase [Methylolobus aquaticus]|nr:glycosyl-4,4'-diaponeurosporenoate acyltransferase [Methylolobus aquaticus]